MYSIATLFGVAFAVLYLKYREKVWKWLEADLELAFMYAGIGAAVGSKLLYLLVSWREVAADLPFLIVATNAFLEKYLYSGFVFYGGLFGALAAVWIYCKRCRLPFDRFSQILLPLFPLIHCFGRIGCFCAGCCYGIPTDSPFGVVFHHSPFAPNGIPLVPVQLMEAAAEMLLFIALAKASEQDRDGIQMIAGYMILYGMLRFALELLRGDAYRGFIGAWSVSQIISVACILTGFFVLYRCKMKTPVG